MQPNTNTQNIKYQKTNNTKHTQNNYITTNN